MTDEQAKKAHNERIERAQKQAQLLRLDYNLALLDLGLDEELTLQFGSNAIQPAIKLIEVTPEQAKQSKDYLTKVKADMNAMSGIVTE